MNESDSARWKQSRLLVIDLVNIAIFLTVIPIAAYAIHNIGVSWSAYKDPAHWTTCNAHVLSVWKQREGGKGNRYYVFVKMRVPDGAEVEDTYAPIRKNDAVQLMNEVHKAGTVTVYQNNLRKSEYVLSPVFTSQRLFMPSFLLWWAGTVVGLIVVALVWRYLRERIDSAAVIRQRLYATARTR